MENIKSLLIEGLNYKVRITNEIKNDGEVEFLKQLMSLRQIPEMEKPTQQYVYTLMHEVLHTIFHHRFRYNKNIDSLENNELEEIVEGLAISLSNLLIFNPDLIKVYLQLSEQNIQLLKDKLNQ